MDNKIKTKIPFLDNITEGGIPAGKLTCIIGKSVLTPHPFFKMHPEGDGYRFIFNLEQSEAITKHGKCIIDEMIKKCKENGIDTSSIKSVTTKMEKIGNTFFPVNYYEDGTITVDYPSRLKK